MPQVHLPTRSQIPEWISSVRLLQLLRNCSNRSQSTQIHRSGNVLSSNSLLTCWSNFWSNGLRLTFQPRKKHLKINNQQISHTQHQPHHVQKRQPTQPRMPST